MKLSVRILTLLLCLSMLAGVCSFGVSAAPATLTGTVKTDSAPIMIDGKETGTTLTTERDALQGKVKGYETDALKQKIAKEKGIPMDMASRLTGDDEKALRADADTMAGLLKAYKGPAPLHDPSPKDPDPKTADMTSMLRDLRGE